MNILFRVIKCAIIALGMMAFATTAQAEYTDDCITFSSAASFTLKANNGKTWDGTLWTSTDKTNWTEWNGAEVSATQCVTDCMYNLYVRGNTSNTKITGFGGGRWVLTGTTDIECTGNIETLRGATGDAPSPTPMAQYCYSGLFCYCYALTSAPKLPATTLSVHCYSSMFSDCRSLKAAPTLPATTLADSCYYFMFYDCLQLTSAPVLPATTLTDWCYGAMFEGCSRLTEAPALPAMTMKVACYEAMFKNCTALLEAPALPAMTLASNCYDSMFNHCTRLTSVPELPATKLASYCYLGMFKYCFALTLNTATPGKAWKIPAISGPTGWGMEMFDYTAGNLTGQPELNKTYYIAGVQEGYTDDCITFSSAASFTLEASSGSYTGWDGMLLTSTDKTNWRKWKGWKITAAQKDGESDYKLYVRGNTNNTVISSYDSYKWVLDGAAGIACSGNIETLRGATGNKPSPTPMARSCYAQMFSGCTLLMSAPDLPATTLAMECYYCMFSGCSALTVSPALPATTLAYKCYSYMFSRCTSLGATPNLPATTLAENCYAGMFYGCTSLTTLPALLATTLAGSCYYRMFYGCSALEVNMTAPGREWVLPSATTATGWGTDMFTGTGGTLQGQPALSTTYYIASAPSEPIEPGGEIVVPEGEAEEKATEINNNLAVKAQYLNAPGGVETTSDYLACFDAVATSGSTIEFVLNEEGTNQIENATTTVKTAALDVVFSGGSTLTVSQPLVGFYYSLRQGKDVSVGDKADLNKIAGRDTISFELTKEPDQYFYQSLVTPAPVQED